MANPLFLAQQRGVPIKSEAAAKTIVGPDRQQTFVPQPLLPRHALRDREQDSD
jgi:hypothetical protein